MLGISSRASDRHGGPEHRYWVHRIANHLRAHGCEVSIEHPIGNGKTIDLLATRNGHKIAFEIETGKSDALANVQKCLKAGVDKVVAVAVSACAYDVLHGRFRSRPKVDVMTAREAARWLAGRSCSVFKGSSSPSSHPRRGQDELDAERAPGSLDLGGSKPRCRRGREECA